MTLLVNQVYLCRAKRNIMATELTNPIRKFLPRIILLVVLASAGWYGYQYWKNSQLYETTDNAQVEGKSAPVLARVAGYVQTLNAEDYQKLQSNQLVAVIDSQEYSIAVAQAEADYQQSLADLENARANLRNVSENIKVANANASVQISRRDKAKTDLQRDQNLFKGSALTQRQLDESTSGVDIQEKQLSATQAQVTQAQVSQGVATANIKKMEAIVQVKKTVLEQQQLRLSYTKIYAPISGKTGKVNISTGQYVQPGQTLFTIINDSTYWIIANFKETQLEKMHVGQAVKIKADAFPNLDITGKISTISEATGAKYSLLPPDNASGNFVKVTQRVPVKIELDNPQQYKDVLRAGLSVEVSVRVVE